jgi:hypothetical protein
MKSYSCLSKPAIGLLSAEAEAPGWRVNSYGLVVAAIWEMRVSGCGFRLGAAHSHKR